MTTIINFKTSAVFKQILKDTAEKQGCSTSELIRKVLHKNLSEDENLSAGTQEFLKAEAKNIERKRIHKMMKFTSSQAFWSHRTVQHFDKLFNKKNRIPEYYVDTSFDLWVQYCLNCDEPAASLSKLLPYFKGKKYTRGTNIIQKHLKELAFANNQE